MYIIMYIDVDDDDGGEVSSWIIYCYIQSYTQNYLDIWQNRVKC